MTKLKIKEKVNLVNGIEETVENLNSLIAGDMIYSYDCDMLLMVVTDSDGGFGLVDLNEGEQLSEEENEFWDEYLQRWVDAFGPFYLVDKAKLTFKIGA